jgi:hypothetical protein
MIAAMRIGKGIDDVLSSITPGEVEEQQQVHVEGDNYFATAAEKYAAFSQTSFPSWEFHKCLEKLRETVSEVLTPTEMQAFLLATTIYDDCERYERKTGVFVSQLLQNSYDAGHNEFVLNTRSLPRGLEFLGYNLRGTEERPIKVEVLGDVGDDCARNTVHLTMTFHDNVRDSCARASEYFTGTFRVKVGRDCGYRSAHFNGVFEDFVEMYCARESRDFIGVFHGDIECFFARDSVGGTYKTTSEQLLEKLKREISTENTLVYIKTDKTEVVVR